MHGSDDPTIYKSALRLDLNYLFPALGSGTMKLLTTANFVFPIEDAAFRLYFTMNNVYPAEIHKRSDVQALLQDITLGMAHRHNLLSRLPVQLSYPYQYPDVLTCLKVIAD